LKDGIDHVLCSDSEIICEKEAGPKQTSPPHRGRILAIGPDCHDSGCALCDPLNRLVEHRRSLTF
jgi:hypothetical protein